MTQTSEIKSPTGTNSFYSGWQSVPPYLLTSWLNLRTLSIGTIPHWSGCITKSGASSSVPTAECKMLFLLTELQKSGLHSVKPSGRWEQSVLRSCPEQTQKVIKSWLVSKLKRLRSGSLYALSIPNLKPGCCSSARLTNLIIRNLK